MGDDKQTARIKNKATKYRENVCVIQREVLIV